MSEGNGTPRQVELQFEREEVLELRLLDEQASRARLQMQLIQQQGQRLSEEIKEIEVKRKATVRQLSAKYMVDLNKFSIDTDTNIASGTVEAEGEVATG